MAVTNVNNNNSTTAPVPAPASADPLRGVDLSSFMKMMITELQNQDPLNPMDNSQILSQISQIQQIQSSASLTSTLGSVSRGQSLSSASALIGRNIKALDSDGNDVTGKVDKVTITDNTPTLVVGTSEVSLDNIREVLP